MQRYTKKATLAATTYQQSSRRPPRALSHPSHANLSFSPFQRPISALPSVAFSAAFLNQILKDYKRKKVLPTNA